MSDPVELKACPFCGGTDVSPSSWDVKCSGCGAEMPGAPLDAMEKWNRRPPNRDGVLEEAAVETAALVCHTAFELAEKLADAHNARDRDSTSMEIDEELVFLASCRLNEASEQIGALLAALKTQDQEHGGSDA